MVSPNQQLEPEVKMILFKRSNSVYYLKYKDEFGNEKRISTKCTKKNDAIKFLTNFKNELEQKTAIKTISLIKAKEQYLEYCKIHFSKKHHLILTYNLNNFVTATKDKPINKVTKSEIENFIHAKLLENKIHLAVQLYKNIKSFFNWSLNNDYLQHSPVNKIKAPKPPEQKPIWINKEQFGIILKNVSDTKLKDIYEILFNTGLRANELLSLDWSNIDLENKLIHIRNSDSFQTKTGKERIVPMNEKVYVIIQRQPTRFIKGLLFINDKKVKYNVDYISKQFKTALRNTNLDKYIHLHSLRHSFASNLAKQGISLFQIGKLLGHTKPQTTMIYSHISPNDLRQVVNQL